LFAAKKVAAVCPKARFLLVGDGILRSSLQAAASALQLDKVVTFAGSRADIPELLSMTDISVLPSHSEGMSNSILESMAMSKPVLATNVGGNSQLVVDGVTGILVPPQDPEAMAAGLLELLNDPQRAWKMGQEGRKRVEADFDICVTAGKMEELYETLLTERSNGSLE
jgi:glycosyltransferase involved in cell wall biosynthesis